ncbi:MAG: HEAT repeat domain-containing protein [Lentisphaerae bacterium]|nr:HEAT repeat domain-containing protein [Lentisphaerota bacterium]
MRYETERKLAARAKNLGEGAAAEALPELVGLTQSPSPLVRRIAASAIGKLAGVAEAAAAVAALRPLLGDTHPQVRQYAAKALGTYGCAAKPALPTLRDMLRNPAETDYVKRSVTTAGLAIRTALEIDSRKTVQTCRRCGRAVAPDEYARSQRFFERTLCDICFDQTATERRNKETRIEDQKHIRTVDGTLVQSDGERRIAEWLAARGIAYRYDARLRIIEGFQIRPDFYLPEYDVYIEYWGMDTPRYKAGMHLKQDLYMHAGKRLISLYPADKPCLDDSLGAKLAQFGRREVHRT